MTPVCPMAPFLGLRPQVPSLADYVVSSSLSVTSLLLSAPGASPFLPSSIAAAPASFPHAPVPFFSYFPSVLAPFVATFIWSLPSIPSCWAPLSSLSAPLASPGFSLGHSAPPPPPLSLLPSAPGFPSALPAPLSAVGLSGPPGFPTSSSGALVDPGTHASGGAPPSASRGSGFGFPGALGTSDPDDASLHHGLDDSSVKGESALGKADFSKAFHEVVTLITGFFPHVKPSSSSSSEESVPWMDICGPSSSCDPRIFLSFFDKMSALSKKVNEKFRKTADEWKKTSIALPRWVDIYCLGQGRPSCLV